MLNMYTCTLLLLVLLLMVATEQHSDNFHPSALSSDRWLGWNLSQLSQGQLNELYTIISLKKHIPFMQHRAVFVSLTPGVSDIQGEERKQALERSPSS